MDKEVLSKTPSLYASVTAKIIAAIEAGAGEFVLPWHRSSGAITRPANAATGATYRGVNVVALWAEAMLSEFPNGYWGTYRQWASIGAQVRKGEHGAVVVYYGQHDRRAADGGEEGEATARRGVVARASYVFNAAQVEGWQAPELPTGGPASIVEPAETVITASGADIQFGGDAAYYDPRRDRICVPARQAFVGSATSTADEAYYATLLHELVHWSGAEARLARTFGPFGSEDYAREELVAELGAAFLCSDLGVANEPRADHAAYLATWLDILRHDQRAIFKAARLAELAVTFLQDLAKA